MKATLEFQFVKKNYDTLMEITKQVYFYLNLGHASLQKTI